MSKITMQTCKVIKYQGVIITIRRRSLWPMPSDFDYTTSDGISGIGQGSVAEAERDARAAIDRKQDDLALD